MKILLYLLESENLNIKVTLQRVKGKNFCMPSYWLQEMKQRDAHDCWTQVSSDYNVIRYNISVDAKLTSKSSTITLNFK